MKQFIFSSINPSINFDHLIKPINDRVGWMPMKILGLIQNLQKIILLKLIGLIL